MEACLDFRGLGILVMLMNKCAYLSEGNSVELLWFDSSFIQGFTRQFDDMRTVVDGRFGGFEALTGWRDVGHARVGENHLTILNYTDTQLISTALHAENEHHDPVNRQISIKGKRAFSLATIPIQQTIRSKLARRG